MIQENKIKKTWIIHKIYCEFCYSNSCFSNVMIRLIVFSSSLCVANLIQLKTIFYEPVLCAFYICALKNPERKHQKYIFKKKRKTGWNIIKKKVLALRWKSGRFKRLMETMLLLLLLLKRHSCYSATHHYRPPLHHKD